MKLDITLSAVLLAATLFSTSAISDNSFELGGDVYQSDGDAIMSGDSDRDVFVAGFSVEVEGDVAQDAHAAGFDIKFKSDVGGNLYAAGSNVLVDGKVGKDLTIAGFTVNLTGDANVLGNARIAAGNMTVDAPVAGSLIASGGSIKLNDSIQGDVRLTASDIKFGSDAVINGSLTYYSNEEIAIPASVISSDRVTFRRMRRGDAFREFSDTVDKSVPDFWPQTVVSKLAGAVVMIGFLLIVSAVFLAFAPESIARMKNRASEHAWRSIFYGFLGISTLFGAILVSILTIVGIPLAPFVLLALIVVWTLGYLLGVYVIAARIWHSFEIASDAVFSNLLVLASGLIAMVVVNFIPFFGWLLNLGVMFFGVGAMTYAVMEQLVRRHEASSPRALPEPINANGVTQ